LCARPLVALIVAAREPLPVSMAVRCLAQEVCNHGTLRTPQAAAATIGGGGAVDKGGGGGGESAMAAAAMTAASTVIKQRLRRLSLLFPIRDGRIQLYHRTGG
jgi:hypothetical protein